MERKGQYFNLLGCQSLTNSPFICTFNNIYLTSAMFQTVFRTLRAMQNECALLLPSRNLISNRGKNLREPIQWNANMLGTAVTVLMCFISTASFESHSSFHRYGHARSEDLRNFPRTTPITSGGVRI